MNDRDFKLPAAWLFPVLCTFKFTFLFACLPDKRFQESGHMNMLLRIQQEPRIGVTGRSYHTELRCTLTPTRGHDRDRNLLSQMVRQQAQRSLSSSFHKRT